MPITTKPAEEKTRKITTGTYADKYKGTKS